MAVNESLVTEFIAESYNISEESVRMSMEYNESHWSNHLLLKNCNELEVFNVTHTAPIEYASPMYGIAMPALFCVTALANSLIIAVLTRRHMKSPTNLVLLWMAIADLLTLAFPSPWYFYMYTLDKHRQLLSSTVQCYFYNVMSEHLPMAFHTSSIWLTILLALQRYIYICHPTLARTFCTVPRVSRAILAIFLAAFSTQASRFFDTHYTNVGCYDSNELMAVTSACHQQIASWVPVEIYFFVYFVFRIIFVNLGPCIALVILNVLLFLALKKAQAKRRKLLKDKPETSSRSLSNSTTYMLMVVVSIFLLVEFPMAVATMIHVLANLGVIGFEGDSHLPALLLTIHFCNFIIMLSFPLNFAIYCGMSAQFRNTFQTMMSDCFWIGRKSRGHCPVGSGVRGCGEGGTSSRVALGRSVNGIAAEGETGNGSADAARGNKIAPEAQTLAIVVESGSADKY